MSQCDHDDVMTWTRFQNYWPFTREIYRCPSHKIINAQLWLGFDLSLNKLLNKHLSGQWFETPCFFCRCSGTSRWRRLVVHTSSAWFCNETRRLKTHEIFSNQGTLLPSPWTKWPLFRRRRFRCIFVKEKFCILIKISPKAATDNKPSLD